MIPAQLPRASPSGALPDHPVIAKFAVTGGNGNDTTPWLSATYRARNGSVRSETRVGARKFVMITDVPGSQLIALDYTDHTAVAATYSSISSGSVPMWGFNLLAAFTDEHKQILNLDCRRIFLHEDGREMGEIWIAEELGLVLEDRQVVGNQETLWHATSVLLQDPADDLFGIPPGFEVFRSPQ